MTRSRTVTAISVAAIFLAAGFNAPAKSEELRIGFIAPLTGIFAQVGKDIRITSYNVCYTKLLRASIAPNGSQSIGSMTGRIAATSSAVRTTMTDQAMATPPA